MISKIERRFSGGCPAEGIHVVVGIIVIVFTLLCSTRPVYAVPPRLHADGNKIKDPDGNIVVLRGVSMIDLGSTEIWWGGAINAIDRLTNQNDATGNSPGWYTKIIRVPICPNDSPLCGNSPLTINPRDPDEPNNPLTRALLRTVVDYCALKNVYVIIDYHHMANTYDEVAETNTFWEYMAPEFANDSHVLFELFNEPINLPGSPESDRWDSVRNDMQTWVNTVRNYAPDNLILVGSPNYCQILAPVVNNPIVDDNIVYVSHIYPCHWRGIYGPHDYYTNHITTCAAVYPVIVTEWGFTEDPNFGTTFFNGTISNYGRPLKAFLEQYGIGNTAWCASNSIWGSPMFWRDWTLRCGEGEMGCFVKDWLYEKSGIEQTSALTITKCKVAAGKTQFAEQGPDANDINKMKDYFEASGTYASKPVILTSITEMDINIVSLNDDSIIYSESIDFNAADVVGDKFSYSHRIPAHTIGAITSLKMNFAYKTFSIKAKNIDFTGLGCPLRLNLAFGNNVLSDEVNETIVNKGKLIPTRLMRLYDDKLVVNKAKAVHKTTPAYDSLYVKGEIAVENMNLDANEPNLVVEDVNISWSDANGANTQTFTIPGSDTPGLGSFKTYRKGHVYTCKGVDSNLANANTDQVTAKFDFDKCTFTVSIKKANSIYVEPGNSYAKFRINFAIPGHDDFNEVVDVNLATRRSF